MGLDPTTQVFTGPYIIKSYTQAGTSRLFVTPTGTASSTVCARLTQTDRLERRRRPHGRARQTLDSTDLLMADTPPAAVLKTAYEGKKAQLSIAPLGSYYAALNTQTPPFNNINLRKAVIAA